jgi:hypothetical protein
MTREKVGLQWRTRTVAVLKCYYRSCWMTVLVQPKSISSTVLVLHP